MTATTGTLRELCELIVDCPHFTPEWTDSGYIVIRNQNIRDGKLDLSQPSYTHREDFERRIRRAKPRAGDIIFTREAPMGEVCMVPEGLECCVGQRQVLLRPKSSVDGSYLFYALRSPYVRHQIFWNEGTGSTVSNVRIPVLEALRIPRLGVAEKPIGQMLGSLDDKIELNRKMNEALEAMAQAIFRDWFVDFGPTRRKIEGASDPVEIMGGLVANVERARQLAERFPARFEGNGLPEGWGRKPLLDEAQLISGGTPKTDREEYWDGGVAWASAKDVSQCGETYLLATERTISEAGLQNSSTKLVPQFSTVVVARGATTGRLCMFGETMAMNQTCYALSSRSKRPFLLNNMFKALVDSLVQAAHGSVFDTITTKTLATADVLEAERVAAAFEEIATPLYRTIENNARQSVILAATRDLLLPKLMSGEIRLPEAQEVLEAAQ
ncbi:type I restriction enzyme S subunit [Sinorhizobium terangae]|uniref:Restriction endonuclease subunit S n=1 Tax=Sinorhizobium terangae TaxID=110322 RepID=A0A6N7LBR9_SINTE|nr:restriction endonuclease subunit S [Sinorhizobium terangae]MBB4183920.1 type I restriction enzyme S subunit [Sinorhizobium terangae]MQX15056.1 restriction endonuclease subunit S [Sinorhizobium terangae]